ncbi:hypothetical protein [Sphingorhabdus sp.]|jgi:hypothetical protein|uniref:hypothetical protein n=1 Tax=Sphingorhabdus sp. TaxID=1902408 RepID=UPI0037C63603
MKTIRMATFAAEVEARKRELGVVDYEATKEALRNKGGTRTPEKRAFLVRIEVRAKAA